MKLTLIFKDREYARALIESVGRMGCNVLVKLCSRDTLPDDDSILITDANIINSKDLVDAFGKRIIFLTTHFDEMEAYSSDENLKVLFKYSCVETILEEAAMLASETLVAESYVQYSSVYKVYVLCDGNNRNAEIVANRLAKQFVYKSGYYAAVLSMLSIFCDSYSYGMSLQRFMFTLNNNRVIPVEMIMNEDDDGIGRFRLSTGVNPLKLLNADKFDMILDLIKRSHYRLLIVVLGDEIRKSFPIDEDEEKLILWIDEHTNEEVGLECARMIGAGKKCNFAHMDLKNLEVPQEVWIDNLAVRIMSEIDEELY